MATTKAIQLATGELSELTLTGDLSFNDNDKAIFGAGSDLQIYHDGSNSYITDNGTGELVLSTNGAKIGLANASPFEWMVEANINGAVNLYYDSGTYSNAKLSTTSTGIDVTGDEIIRNGTGGVASTGGTLWLTTGSTNGSIRSAGIQAKSSTTSNDHSLLFYTNAGSSSPTERMRIDTSGHLLVGKTSANSNLTGAELRANGNIVATRNNSWCALFNRQTSDGDIALFYKDGVQVGSIGTTSGTLYVDFGDWTITESGGSLYFAVNGINKMKLDANGNLDVAGNVNSNATIS